MDMYGVDMKKILFIGPRFYNFETHIVNAIKKINFEVDFFNEKPELNIWFRIIQKLPKVVFEKYLDSYYQKIVNIKKQYDYVFIIRAEMIDEKYLNILKLNQKNAEFIMYQWDFVDNLPKLKSQIKYFDKIYTFDANDANTFNFKLKPLFFTNEHINKSKEKRENKYKVSFIGSHHSDRFEFIKLFKRVNHLDTKEFFYHLYRPRLSYIYNKYIKKNKMGDLNFKDLQSNIITEKDTLDILNNSNTVLDIHHVKQAGLTIRSLEALGLKKKLITTNPLINEYDFYNSNNIFQISRENPYVPEEFFTRDYKEINNNIYNSYCVDEWIKEFFNMDIK